MLRLILRYQCSAELHLIVIGRLKGCVQAPAGGIIYFISVHIHFLPRQALPYVEPNVANCFVRSRIECNS